MSACVQCEVLPPRQSVAGVLYVALPLPLTQDNLRQYVERATLSYREPQPGTLAIDVTPTDLRQMSVDLPRMFSAAELDDAKTLLTAPGVEPTLADFLNVQSLSRFLARSRGDWLIDLLEANRIASYFQPIVSSSDPASVYAYEAVLRGFDENGAVITPLQMFSAARDAGLLFYLDRAARLTSIRDALRHGITSHIFVNFNPTSIYNPEACLQSTMHAIHEANIVPERLIFEVVESDDVRDVRHLLRILDFYRRQGFRVALDDIGSGYGSLNLLAELKPDFIKLDMKLVRNVHLDPYKAEVARKVLELAQNLGIKTVAEGIEVEGEWRWAADNGADYVQGFLFAQPASPPPLPRVPAGSGATLIESPPAYSALE